MIAQQQHVHADSTLIMQPATCWSIRRPPSIQCEIRTEDRPVAILYKAPGQSTFARPIVSPPANASLIFCADGATAPVRLARNAGHAPLGLGHSLRIAGDDDPRSVGGVGHGWSNWPTWALVCWREDCSHRGTKTNGGRRRGYLRARSEAEPLPTPLDGHFRETRGLQPPPERAGIDRRVRVAEMDEPEEKGVDAVEAGEDAAGPQHPPSLRQQPVLQRRRRDVVQHRERHDAGEGAVRERHRRPVAMDDAHARAVQPLLRARRRPWRPPPGPSAAASGRGASRS